VEYGKKLEHVVVSEEYLSMCTEPGAAFITEKVQKNNLNRVIVAACTPKTHEPVFHAVLKEAGLPPRMLEFVNIREHCSFVHMNDPSAALHQAKNLIRAAVQRALYLEAVPTKVVPVNPEALVVGGGIAGLSAALDLANQGFKVYLVEKELSIGGRMSQMDRTFPTDDCAI
jgi:heterodisulfide reductase subunit A